MAIPSQQLLISSLVRILTTLIVMGSVFPANLRAEFTIQGHGSPLNPGSKLRLLREDVDKRSQTLEEEIPVRPDHSFSASFESEPGLFSLEIPGYQKLALAIDTDQELTLVANSANPTGFMVEGSRDTDLLHAYETFRKESLARLVYPPRNKLNRAKDAGASSEEQAPLAKAEVDGYAAHRRELNDFTIEHVGPSIALYATSLRWDPDYRLGELQYLVASFSRIHPDLAITRSMQERLHRFSRTAIGAMAAPITGKTLEGKTLLLGDFQDSIVLLDFWASWCVPCRVENRHYPELLDNYAGDGLEIFAVNLDESRSAWAKASQQDGITWPHISDSLGLNSPLAKAYNVTALPMSFLLDRDGRILARNLRGDALSTKLAEIFEK